MHAVASGLEKLSSGDLLFRLTTDFGGDYEKLRGDFNAAMERLQETMQAIATNTQGVRSGAEEITQASDDLSRRTEQQAASLEETAAALDQITATVRRTAEVANEARNLVSTSQGDAERSGDVVRQTVGAMDGIESSSKQIANIIGVIDEIAFQTNLLALERGRGSGARRRCRARLCGGGHRGAGAGAALRRCREGNQSADLRFDAAGRCRREAGRAKPARRWAASSPR